MPAETLYQGLLPSLPQYMVSACLLRALPAMGSPPHNIGLESMPAGVLEPLLLPRKHL